MDEAKRALAERAAKARGFRWMAGMRVLDCERVVEARSSVTVTTTQELSFDTETWGARSMGPPDLDDPATIGCLLALVREAWGDDTIVVVHEPGRGGVAYALINWTDTLPFHIQRRTYEGVLVAALEAAP